MSRYLIDRIEAWWAGFDDLPVLAMKSFEEEFLKFMEEKYPDVGHDLRNTKDLAAATEAKLKAAVVEFKGAFLARRNDGKPVAAAAR